MSDSYKKCIILEGTVKFEEECVQNVHLDGNWDLESAFLNSKFRHWLKKLLSIICLPQKCSSWLQTIPALSSRAYFWSYGETQFGSGRILFSFVFADLHFVTNVHQHLEQGWRGKSSLRSGLFQCKCGYSLIRGAVRCAGHVGGRAAERLWKIPVP